MARFVKEWQKHQCSGGRGVVLSGTREDPAVSGRPMHEFSNPLRAASKTELAMSRRLSRTAKSALAACR